MDIITDVAKTFKAGQQAISNTATTQLTGVGKATRGIHVKAHPNNTDIIYVGGSDVTSSTGFPLQSGQEITLPIQDVSEVYGLANVNGEILCWVWA